MRIPRATLVPRFALGWLVVGPSARRGRAPRAPSGSLQLRYLPSRFLYDAYPLGWLVVGPSARRGRAPRAPSGSLELRYLPSPFLYDAYPLLAAVFQKLRR